MISWSSIAYGAALSAVAAVVLVLAVQRERRVGVLAAVAFAALAGPVAWNAILRDTGARSFFHDAPIAVMPASWQDTGSGVFALAVAAVVLGLGPLAQARARATTATALLCGLAAFLVDVYLY